MDLNRDIFNIILNYLSIKDLVNISVKHVNIITNYG